jgi:hypothetical protein
VRDYDAPEIPFPELVRCTKCGRPCCQCALCAKAKAHSGLCSPCFKSRGGVEPTEVILAGKPSEAKPKTRCS